MQILIITLSFIASLFLSRWLNMKLWQIDNDYPILPLTWFIPIITPVCLILLIFTGPHTRGGEGNWFTGKHWKK